MRIYVFIIAFCLAAGPVFSQYPPAAGLPGTTAISADSTIWIAWASECSVIRGPVDISGQTAGLADFGSDTAASGAPDLNVVSLGDGGVALLRFFPPVRNGEGYDFAVFENAFNDGFLELAKVEVSTDGIYFCGFYTVSLTQTDSQTTTFALTDPTQIHNLAGKYRGGFGTPFDLDSLNGSCPEVNPDSICWIRITDVVGSINPEYANYDSQGNIINDPWPTPFNTSGFDLDAVGAIYVHPAFAKPLANQDLSVLWQPGLIQVLNPASIIGNHYRIMCPDGRIVQNGIIPEDGRIDFAISVPSLIIMTVDGGSGSHSVKIVTGLD
jgi:hypothetical protein